MSYLGVGVSPGTVPVYHNTKVLDRKIRITELVLRCVILGLGVVAAVLIGTDSQVLEIFSIKKKAKFTDMKALVFLVIASGKFSKLQQQQSNTCKVYHNQVRL
ncbi:hypothetical protein RIF29_01937 [Crotalaria pallida]|uniref:CASP-like protein n=1 Tax=Crotalaria pallida TaxID=3830 RepID=A0AAN9IXV4_CROPI